MGYFLFLSWDGVGRIRIIIMEDSRIKSHCEADAKVQQQWKQGFKDSIQIENRVKILELEKQKKIKDIEKKLNAHKKSVELKIIKHHRHQDLENLNEKEKMNVTQFFNRFQTEKRQRAQNIKTLKFQLVQSKNREFWSVKKEREEIEKKISEQKMQDKEEKVEKRNRVRLMEIESKENLYNSWSKRLDEMRQGRQRVIDKKMKEHEQNLIWIAKMEKKEQKMLDEIYKAEEMEKELGEMIINERKMNGRDLAQLYTTMS